MSDWSTVDRGKNDERRMPIVVVTILIYNILSLRMQGKTKITPEQERQEIG